MVTGCSSTIPPRPEDPGDFADALASTDDVYLLRGLWNIFSKGMDSIGESLQQEGLKAGVFPGNNWKPLARQIIDRNERGELGPALIISGHSYGADDAIRLARALGENGVEVDALVLVDPTFPPKIPPNVRRTINIYRSKPSTDWMPWLRGVPVKAADSSTPIFNRDLRMTEDAEFLEELDHFNIEDSPEIQQMVVQEIITIYRSIEQGTASRVPGEPIGQGLKHP